MEPVRIIREDLVVVDWGPTTMTVSAWAEGTARPVMAAKAARAALHQLKILADFQNLLRRPARRVPGRLKLPRVVARAVDAVREVGGGLTPLAAVAGALADQTAEAAVEEGADRVIVNNGGDIAVRVGGADGVVVGLKPPGGDDIVGRLEIKPLDGVGGVAASGWSGRSFSPGVADLVSVWAVSAALADAAATLIAARCTATGPAVTQVPAEAIDAQSDLGGRLVTLDVGPLTAGERRTAVRAGLRAARRLMAAGSIRGCVILIQGDRAALDPDGRVVLA